MPSLSSAADRLERLAAETGGAAERAIADAIRRLEVDIATALGSKAEWRYADMAEALARLEDALAASGLDEIAQQVLAVAEDMAAEVGGLDLVEFSQEDANLLRQAVEAKYTAYQQGPAREPVEFLRQRLIGQTISPVSTKELVDALVEKFEGTYQQHYYTWVNTALNQQVADTWLVATRSIQEKTGDTRLRYFGPDDEKTRPFCRMALAGNPWSREDAEALLNDDGQPALAYRGGYNCRHSWTAYVDI